MQWVRYDRQLRRLWVCGIRSHHGLWGLAAFVIGLWAMWDDRKDFPWWGDTP